MYVSAADESCLPCVICVSVYGKYGYCAVFWDFLPSGSKQSLRLRTSGENLMLV